MSRTGSVSLLFMTLAWLAWPCRVAAYAVIEIRSADGVAEGFNDTTPVSPIGGNAGTTLGEQRMIAVQHAADLWGELVDSEVTIVVEAVFDEIPCTAGSTTELAHAGAASLEFGVDGEGSNPAFIYPAALADRLNRDDLRPGQPDIIATFNSTIDLECIVGTRWYYGLDAQHGNDADLVNVALHEFGHGLGFNDYVNRTTGALLGGAPTAFTAHVLDLTSDKHFDESTNAERLASLRNVRNVVWDGPQVNLEAPSFLVAGTPRFSATPIVAGLSGLASDATFGAASLAMSVSAPLVVAPNGCPTVGLFQRIAIFSGGCAYSTWALFAQDNGAVGVLLTKASAWAMPPIPFEESSPETVRIPVLSVSEADAALLTNAAGVGTVTLSLSYDSSPRGADAQGRVRLNVTDPTTSSSLAHWDTLPRPNLLMEPFANSTDSHDTDLTRAFMIDLGWTPFCGNARLDQEEECDGGEDNSNTEPDACREKCKLAGCGDHVVDSAEACDDGPANSDTAPDACRGDCTLSGCGDGVTGKRETCDDGDNNSDTEPNACRSDCTAPRCGDGVADASEDCDSGDKNSDTEPNACRSDCTAPRCGDSVTDAAESCDDGVANNDTKPDACRSDCSVAHCGDGVTDNAESCDNGAANSDAEPNACRSNCETPRCGDNVADTVDRCEADPGMACTKDCPQPHDGVAAGMINADADSASARGSKGGCGCRVVGGPARRAYGWVWLLCVLGVCGWRHRRQHRAVGDTGRPDSIRKRA